MDSFKRYSYAITMCSSIKHNHQPYAIIGAGARSKYGNGAGLLQKATGSKDVTSIIHEYADATLVGAAVKCDAASAGEVSS